VERKEAETLILNAYKEKYPNWKDVRVLEIVKSFGGSIAVISSTIDKSQDNEEMCYVYPDKKVRIFDTTPELVYFFETQARNPLLERLVAKPVISGAVFVLVLVGLFLLAVFKIDVPAPLMASLTSVVGVAAGFFFGSAKN
jgi:hypothetical protein